MKICGNCKWWALPENNNYPLPDGFKFCKAINVHEGEMCETKYDKGEIPPQNTHLLICTSEWFQHFGTSLTFGCILWQNK